MKKIFSLILLFFTIISFVNSQKVAKFKYVTENKEDNVYEIVFTILGIQDDKHAEQILQAFYAHEEVKSCKIFYNKRCKIVLDMSVDRNNAIYADKCREILLANNVDLDIDYVIPLSKSVMLELKNKKEQFKDNYVPHPIPSNEWVYPKELSELIQKESLKGDKKQVEKAKTKWIEEHPEEYKKMTGVEYLDYSIYLDTNK